MREDQDQDMIMEFILYWVVSILVTSDQYISTTLSIMVRLSPFAACVDRIVGGGRQMEIVPSQHQLHQQQSSSLSPWPENSRIALSAESVTLADA